MKTTKDILNEHLNCICDPIYKSRNLTDPSCAYCEYGSEIEMMMQEYAEQFRIKPVFSKSLKDIALCKKCAGARVWTRQQNTVRIICKNCEPNE